MHLIPPSINLLGTPSAFVPVYVLSGIWQSAGWNSIIFIAALSSVDGQLYDAAKVDGANRWQQVIHVELPALVPTIVILLIMNMGRVLSVGFEKVFHFGFFHSTLNSEYKCIKAVFDFLRFRIGRVYGFFFHDIEADGMYNKICSKQSKKDHNTAYTDDLCLKRQSLLILQSVADLRNGLDLLM